MRSRRRRQALRDAQPGMVACAGGRHDPGRGRRLHKRVWARGRQGERRHVHGLCVGALCLQPFVPGRRRARGRERDLALHRFDRSRRQLRHDQKPRHHLHRLAPYTLYAPGNKCNARFSLTGAASHWTFSDVVIGPTYDSALCGNSGNVNFAPGLSDSTFTRVTFKDSRYQAACGSGQHTENFYFSGPVNNVTFDSCTFSNGANSGAVTGTGPADGTGPSSAALLLTGSFTGLTFKNCVFVGPRTVIDGTVDAVITNSALINNTFTQGSYFQCDNAHCPGGISPTFRIINNIGADQSSMIGEDLG